MLATVLACGPAAPMPAAPAQAPAASAPAAQWFEGLRALCGQAFAGKVLVDTPPQPKDAFSGKALIMHVRTCSESELRVPFAVGDDRSRTWVLRRVGEHLTLAHDHRHEDGSSDEVTLYGGKTAAPGTGNRQEFPVDQQSIDTFQRAGLTASQQNTWAMELWPGQRFVYELARPGGRLFRVEFDLTRPVPAPPPPWGEAPLR